LETRFLMFCLVATLTLPAHAANGVSEKAIEYRDWGGAKPNVVTLISSQMQAQYVMFRQRENVSWLDVNKGQVPALQAHLCALMNRSNGDRCTGHENPVVDIRELFLGTPEEFKASPMSQQASNANYIGLDQLVDLPPGAKTVLQVAIQTMGQMKTVISVAYDDVSDDDLRMIALEDGIYRAARWRSD